MDRGHAKPPLPSIEPNLRRLRAFAEVARWNNVRRAAESLYLTQPTVTRAVQKLERELGLPLFERSAGGMTPTPYGVAVARRADLLFAHLDKATAELAALQPGARNAPSRTTGILAHALTHRHLQALIATSDHGTQSAAAAHLQLSQPAVTQALGDLEYLTGQALLLRTSRGMTATAAGEVLVRRGKLALAELEALRSDIAEHLGMVTGSVNIGVLPMAGTLLVPRAVNRLLQAHPEVRVCLIDGPYDTLLQRLRCGELDVVVGPLRTPCPSNDVVQQPLFDGELSVIARKGHPLAQRHGLALADLLDWEWVLPGSATPARALIEGVMREAGLPMPENPIESNGLATLRALLMESDRITVISRHQIYFEERAGLLHVLPIELRNTARAIGITTRLDASPPKGVLALLDHLRGAAAQPLLA
jgi:LysR family transcriptional regulator of gallate degradation